MQTNGNEEIRSKPHQFPKTSFAEHLMEGHNSTTSMARAAGQGGIILIEFPLFRAFFSRLQFGEADKRNRFSSILSDFFFCRQHRSLPPLRDHTQPAHHPHGSYFCVPSISSFFPHPLTTSSYSRGNRGFPSTLEPLSRANAVDWVV